MCVEERERERVIRCVGERRGGIMIVITIIVIIAVIIMMPKISAGRNRSHSRDSIMK